MNAFAFVVCFALFMGGLLLMGYAFYIPGLELVAFLGGILLSTLAIAIPVHVLRGVNR